MAINFQFSKFEPLTEEFKKIASEIEDQIRSDFGLVDHYNVPLKNKDGIIRTFGFDWDPVLFSCVSGESLNEVCAYGGFPQRYPHYRFAADYERLRVQRNYGGGKLYELVINNNPIHAYLLKNNAPIHQKLVISHVYHHADFFKNNVWFSHTDKNMMDTMAEHRNLVNGIILAEGKDKVRDWLDVCLSLENLIDRYNPENNKFLEKVKVEPFDSSPDLIEVPEKFKTIKNYVNTPEFIEQQRKKKRIEDEQRRKKEKGYICLDRPSCDVLGFLIANSKLEHWQREILSIIRKEALYFAPQAMTKIMNEGWATYWHHHYMTEFFCDASEASEFAMTHSSVIRKNPPRLNPYRLGVKIFEDIKYRWDNGMFTREFLDCDDRQKLRDWDLKTNKGFEKMFEVREIYNDVTFIQEFLTDELIEKESLFSYAHHAQAKQFYISDTKVKEVKKNLVNELSNAGQAKIYVVNVEDNNTLTLVHKHTGVDLKDDPDWMDGTLININRIWQDKVQLLTRMNNQFITYCCAEQDVETYEGWPQVDNLEKVFNQ